MSKPITVQFEEAIGDLDFVITTHDIIDIEPRLKEGSKESVVIKCESIADTQAIEFKNWCDKRAMAFDFEEEINHTTQEYFTRFKAEHYK